MKRFQVVSEQLRHTTVHDHLDDAAEQYLKLINLGLWADIVEIEDENYEA